MTSLTTKLFSTLAAGAVLALTGALAATPALAQKKSDWLYAGDSKYDAKLSGYSAQKPLPTYKPQYVPQYVPQYTPKYDPKYDAKLNSKFYDSKKYW